LIEGNRSGGGGPTKAATTTPYIKGEQKDDAKVLQFDEGEPGVIVKETGEEIYKGIQCDTQRLH